MGRNADTSHGSEPCNQRNESTTLIGRTTDHRGTGNFPSRCRNRPELLGNPSCFAQHFVGNLGYGTVIAGNGKIFQPRTIKNGVQFFHPSNKLVLQDSRVAHLDPPPDGIRCLQ